jgi:hypothetical protein
VVVKEGIKELDTNELVEVGATDGDEGLVVTSVDVPELEIDVELLDGVEVVGALLEVVLKELPPGAALLLDVPALDVEDVVLDEEEGIAAGVVVLEDDTIDELELEDVGVDVLLDNGSTKKLELLVVAKVGDICPLGVDGGDDAPGAIVGEEDAVLDAGGDEEEDTVPSLVGELMLEPCR